MRERIDDERYHQQDAPAIRKVSETNPRAKKEHQCWICNGKILPGELHHRFVYVDCDDLEPKLKTARHHIRCPEHQI